MTPPVVPIIPTRGIAYWADLGHGRKPWLVVSNNGRNANLPSLLAVRITTTPSKSGLLPTHVELGRADGLTGRVLCDDMEQLDRDELIGVAGALSLGTLMKVNVALKAALALL